MSKSTLLIFLFGLLGTRSDELQSMLIFDWLARLVSDSLDQLDNLQVMTIDNGPEKKILEASPFHSESSALFEFHHELSQSVLTKISSFRSDGIVQDLESENAYDLVHFAHIFLFTLGRCLETLPLRTGSHRIEHSRKMMSILYSDWVKWRQNYRSFSGMISKSPQGPLGVFRSISGENIKVEFLPGHRMNLLMPFNYLHGRKPDSMLKELRCRNIRFHVTNSLMMYLVDDDELKECLGSILIRTYPTSFMFGYDSETNMIAGGFSGVSFRAAGDVSLGQDPWRTSGESIHEDAPFGHFGANGNGMVIELLFTPADRLRLAIKMIENEGSTNTLTLMGHDLNYIIDSDQVLLVADENFKAMILPLGEHYVNGMLRITSDPVGDRLIVKVKDREINCPRIFRADSI